MWANSEETYAAAYKMGDSTNFPVALHRIMDPSVLNCFDATGRQLMSLHVLGIAYTMKSRQHSTTCPQVGRSRENVCCYVARGGASSPSMYRTTWVGASIPRRLTNSVWRRLSAEQTAQTCSSCPFQPNTVSWTLCESCCLTPPSTNNNMNLATEGMTTLEH